MDDMTVRAALCRILENQVALGDMLARVNDNPLPAQMQNYANRISYVSEPLIRALGGSCSRLV